MDRKQTKQQFSKELIEIIVSHLSRVDFTMSEVVLHDSRVFVCGGSITEHGFTDRDYQEPKSLRDIVAFVFRDQLKRKNLILAEEAFNNSIFQENNEGLLDFEEIISSFSTAVVVILESVGSYAEIGAFSVNSEIRSKLYAVIEQQYSDANSFIVAGPLRLISEERKVGYQPNFTNGDLTTRQRELIKFLSNEALFMSVVEQFKDITAEIISKQVFSSKNDFHIMLLVSLITQNGLPLKLKEILEILEQIGFPKQESRMRLLLKVAEDFGLIQKVEVGSAYYSAKNPYAKIGFRSDRPGGVDFKEMLLETRALLQQYENRESQRLAAIGAFE